MIIILTTYPNSPKKLKNFIMAILGKKLAKCINRINYVKSYYIWQGKIMSEQEKQLIIKTTDDKKEELIKFIEKNHPYDIPEIIVLNTDDMWEKYMNWMKWN